jgi:hypothetical protein
MAATGDTGVLVFGGNKKKNAIYGTSGEKTPTIKWPIVGPASVSVCQKTNIGKKCRETPPYSRLIRHLSIADADDNVDLLRTCVVAGKQHDDSDTATTPADPVHCHEYYLSLNFETIPQHAP